jgi:hypothetical protein
MMENYASFTILSFAPLAIAGSCVIALAAGTAARAADVVFAGLPIFRKHEASSDGALLQQLRQRRIWQGGWANTGEQWIKPGSNGTASALGMLAAIIRTRSMCARTTCPRGYKDSPGGDVAQVV